MEPKNNSKEERRPTWEPDPFPQPRTIPGGWDLSEMTREKLKEEDWTPRGRKERGSKDEWK
jgi:hypothetical protein